MRQCRRQPDQQSSSPRAAKRVRIATYATAVKSSIAMMALPSSSSVLAVAFMKVTLSALPVAQRQNCATLK
jgi:hypothetical protein